MLGVFLDRDSLDCGDLDFGNLNRILPELRCYSATAPDEVAERIAEAEVVISNQRMVEQLAENIQGWLDGKLMRVVTC